MRCDTLMGSLVFISSPPLKLSQANQPLAAPWIPLGKNRGNSGISWMRKWRRMPKRTTVALIATDVLRFVKGSPNFGPTNPAAFSLTCALVCSKSHHRCLAIITMLLNPALTLTPLSFPRPTHSYTSTDSRISAILAAAPTPPRPALLVHIALSWLCRSH